MKKFNLLCLGLLAAATLAGCSDDTLIPDNSQTEAYVRDFIERYGVPDPNHTYSMASRSGVTVKTSEPTDVLVSAYVGGKEYLFADYKGVDGTKTINFDLPRSVQNLIIYANNNPISAKVGDVVTIKTDGSAKAVSRDGEETKFAYTDQDYQRLLTNEKPVTLKGYEGEDIAISTIQLDSRVVNTNWHNWWGSSYSVLAANMFNQLLNDLPSYQTSNKFKKCEDGLICSVSGSNPTIYFYYIRPGVQFELGVMVGNKPTLVESASGNSDSHLVCIPIMSTGTDGSTTQMVYHDMKKADETNFLKRGAQIEFYFGETRLHDGKEYNVHIAENRIQGSTYEKWPFDDKYAPLKEAIENLADLYTEGADGTRILPLPVDAKSGLTYYDINLGRDVELKDYADFYDEDGNVKGDGENIWEFWNGFQGYLESKVRAYNLEIKLDNKYDDLLMLKEWFAVTRRDFVFTKNDIPEVVRIKDSNGEIIPGAYRVTYRLAKKVDGGVVLPTDGVDFKTNLPNNPYKVVQSMSGGVSMPDDFRYDRQYVYYFKDLSKSKPEMHTTAEVEMYQYVDGFKYTLEGSPLALQENLYCIDIDGDDQIDVVWRHSATGGGPNSEIKPYTWLIACEDLGTTGDFDFNDVVVAVQHIVTDVTVNEEKFSVYPVAAGGIYPTYLMYNEIDEKGNPIVYFVGPEIHKWLGESSHEKMVNTEEDTFDKDLCDGNLRVEHKIVRPFSDTQGFSISMDDDKNNPNATAFGGFWLFVDKNNNLATSTNEIVKKYAANDKTILPVSAEDMEVMTGIFGTGKTVANAASEGNVPMMLILGEDWEWPMERKRISDAYPGFGEWLKTPASHWYGIQNDVYPNGINRELVVKRSVIGDFLNK